MKKLKNLKGAVTLTNVKQKEVNGGRLILDCRVGCAGKNYGDNCYHASGCNCPGQCTNSGCTPW